MLCTMAKTKIKIRDVFNVIKVFKKIKKKKMNNKNYKNNNKIIIKKKWKMIFNKKKEIV